MCYAIVIPPHHYVQSSFSLKLPALYGHLEISESILAKPQIQFTPTVPQAVFVTGIGRSGTSALLKSLGEHPDFVKPVTFGEAPFIDSFLSFLKTYENDPASKMYNLASYKVQPDERYNIFSEMIYKLHVKPAKGHELKKVSYWASKTSIRAETYEKMGELFGPFQVLYIIRNGIEVVNSARHFDGFKALDFKKLCARWRDSLVSNRFLEAESNCTMFRHQDLIQDPYTVLQFAFERMDINHSDGPANFLAGNIFNSSFSATQQGADNASVFKERLKEAWQSWSQEEQAIFLEDCGDEMLRYGFTIPGRQEGAFWKQPEPLVTDITKLRKRNVVRADRLSIIRDFDGTAQEAGAIVLPAALLEERVVTSVDQIQSNIENKIGMNYANYCIHPAPKAGLLYAEVPKVACSTIKYLMQSLEYEAAGATMRTFDRHLVHNRVQSPLPFISKMKPEELSDVFQGDGLKRFTFVRDPFARALSCYLSKLTKNMPQKRPIIAILENRKIEEITDISRDITFREFLEAVSKQSIREMDIHWRPQTDQILLGLIKYDFIGRYEQFLDGLGYLKKMYFPKSRVLLPSSTNATKSGDLFSQYYDSRCIELVRKIYKDDFALLGYDPEPDFTKLAGRVKAKISRRIKKAAYA